MSKPPSLLVTGRGHAPLGVNLYGDIDEDNTAAFTEAFRWIEARSEPGAVVPVYISSMGGDVYGALLITDLIRNRYARRTPLREHGSFPRTPF